MIPTLDEFPKSGLKCPSCGEELRDFGYRRQLICPKDGDMWRRGRNGRLTRAEPKAPEA